MKTVFKIPLIIFTVLLSLLIPLAIFLPSVIDLTRYKGKIEGFIAEALHRDVYIREIRLSILKGIGAELKDIKIGKDTRFIEIEEMRLKVALLPLIQRRIEIKGISLDNTRIFFKDETKRITISHLRLPLTLFRGAFTESKGIEADLYKGRFLGDLRVEKREGETRYSLIHDMKGMEMEPFMKDALGSKVTISGPLKLEGNLKGMENKLERLEGSGSINIGKGKIKGLEISKIIGTIGIITYPQDPSDKKPVSLSDFDRISGHYTIGGGYIRTEDLEMVGRDLHFKAKGSYGLVNSRLDFIVTGEAIDIPVEIQVDGTGSKPTYRLKSSGIEKKVIEEIGKEMKRKTEKEGVDKVLKGLIKK